MMLHILLHMTQHAVQHKEKAVTLRASGSMKCRGFKLCMMQGMMQGKCTVQVVEIKSNMLAGWHLAL
jgi:hypothetical protein